MIITKEYIFKEGDTIEGILKGLSKFPLDVAKEYFYMFNEKKIYKVGEKVIIPIEMTNEQED